MTIGEYVKRKRKEYDMSLREFAEKCDISHSYLNIIEKGADPRTGKPISPTLEIVEKIAIGTNIPLAELLAITGYIAMRDIPVKKDELSEGTNEQAVTLSKRIAQLPEDKRKTIETLLKVYEMENNNENAATSSGK
jgi:transcriptional regulator with XRE-family HTH domain